MKTVAIVGTNGVPARYGGFETLAEHLVRGLGARYRFIVYCGKVPKASRSKEFMGARLVHLPISANGWQSLIYDFLTTLHAFCVADVVLLLGPGFGFVLPLNLVARRRLIVNYGGLNEWDREKLSRAQRWYTLASTWAAAKSATINIADNRLLQASIARVFGRDAKVIRYGGDHALAPTTADPSIEARFPAVGSGYFVSLARAQVDNNIHLLIEAFRQLPEHRLVVVSNWQVSDYGRDLYREHVGRHPNIVLLEAIYNTRDLNYIRSHAKAYIHSHSRCGTAPSLVEAICLGLPIISFDVPTNRETTQEQALYFGSAAQLVEVIRSLGDERLETLRERLRPLAEAEYRWSHVCSQYDAVFSGAPIGRPAPV